MGAFTGAFDSMLALSEGDNIYRVKRHCETYKVDDDYIYSKWKPWNDVEVETWLVPGTPWHIRVHRINTDRLLDTADGGFALGIEDKKVNSDLVTNHEDKACIASMSWGASGIQTLIGGGNAELIYPNSNTNILHSRTVIPTIKTRIKPGTSILVSAVFGETEESYYKTWEETPIVEVDSNRISIKALNEKALEIYI